MKFTVILLTIACLQTSAETRGQRINLHEKNSSLEKVFKEIRNQTGYVFFYEDGLLKKAGKVTVSASSASIEQVLDICFADKPLTYSIVGNTVVIREKRQSILNQQMTYTSQLPAEVRGTITNEQGEPLAGATVTEKGTSNSVVTREDGSFSINTSRPNATLVISYVGFASKEVAVNNQSVISIALSQTNASLNDVVVVGYGTQRRRDVTGSVASVPAQRLEQVPNNNFAQALQGSVPGVNITTNSGGAEQNDMSILIRGRNSITASNNPLIVWDGVPYSGSISDIAPQDIESIEVLKDASATAIYGSRGSNGVVLITSKKGRTGKPVISYDGSYGIQEIANVPDWLTGEEFYKMKEQRQAASLTPSEKEIYQNKTWVNWTDLASRRGSRHQHSLSVSGGTENTKYYISAALTDVKGIAVNDKFSRYSTRINIESSITKWLKLGTNTQLSLSDRSGEGPSWSNVFLTNPLTKAYDSAGNLTLSPWPEYAINENPLAPTLYQNENKTYKVFTNNYINVNLPFVPGLSYRLNTGVEFTTNDWSTYQGRNTRSGLNAGGIANVENNLRNNYVVENVLNYQRQLGKHNVFFTGLYSYQQDKSKMNGTYSQGFPSDVLTWHQANVGGLVQPRSGFNQENIISQMARVNYGYDSRYLLTLTGRRDGYSGFGSERKYGVFPSVAVGWNISNEEFMRNMRGISELKLRASYGENGNQAVGPFRTLSTLRAESFLNGSAPAPGYVPSRLGNPNLGWETTTSTNIGLDFGFLKDRIRGSVDVFNANTDRLLLNRSISTVHGISSITQNIGKTNNRGFELGINTTNIQRGDLSWLTSANLSVVKNKIVDLYGTGKDDLNNRWFIGQPIRVNYGYVFDGVWQTTDNYTSPHQPDAKPGYLKIKDVNKDNKVTDADRQIQGQLDPKTIWGINNTVGYKGLSLYFLVQGMHGHERFNSLLLDDVGDDVTRNTLRMERWTPDNPTNKYFANDRRANSQLVGIIQPLDFVRLKDVSLSYDLSQAIIGRAGLKRTRVYISGRNLATFTKWTGLDPELNDQLNVPLQKEYVLGLNIAL